MHHCKTDHFVNMQQPWVTATGVTPKRPTETFLAVWTSERSVKAF